MADLGEEEIFRDTESSEMGLLLLMALEQRKWLLDEFCMLFTKNLLTNKEPCFTVDLTDISPPIS